MLRNLLAGAAAGLLLINVGCATKHCCRPAVVSQAPPCCPTGPGAAYLPATQVPVTAAPGTPPPGAVLQPTYNPGLPH